MKNYERFLRNRDGGRERTIKSSERLSSEGSNYQKFLKGRETQLEEESDFSRYLKTRQQRNLLEDKRQERESYLDSERDVSLWDAVTSDKTMDDWKQSRAWKKQNQQEIDEAAAQVAAYEQFERDKIFQSEVENMTSADLDKIISDYDRQIGEIKNEGGFWNAVAPGGIKPSEYSENKDKINALQLEQGRYRAVRDEKKSREMTEGLPGEVIGLLDSYNAINTANDRAMLYNLFKPAEQRSVHQEVGTQNSKLIEQQAIADKLKEMGYDNYKELAEYRKYITDKEATQRIEAESKELADENRALASAISLATAPSAAVYGFKNFVPQSETDLRPNPYSEYNVLSAANDTMQSTVSDSFEDGKISAKTKRLLYNTGMSAADSMMTGAFGSPALTGGYFALKSFNSKYNDTLKRGGTTEQAIISGVAAGAAEGIGEAASLGLFLKGVEPTTVGGIVKNVLIQAGVNAQEEATTELINVISDYYINGGISDYYQNYEYGLKQGLSEEEAKEYATKISVEQVTEAALSGAIMGAGFGTVGSAAGNISYNSAMQDIGRNIVENNAVEKELAAASELGVDENDALFKFAKEVEAYQSKKNQNEAYEGTKREMRSLGRLSEGLDVVASDKIKDTSTNAIKDRLSALGEEGNIDDVSSVVLKKATGEKLTKKENHILQKSKYGVRVINELTERGVTSSEWADKVDSNIDDIAKSRNTPDIEAYKSGNTSEKAAETAVTTEKDETPYGFENYEKQVKEKIINEGQDKERFDSDFELFKQYGEAGRSFEEVKSNSTVSKDFTEVQMKSAFDIGVQKAEAKKMTVLKGVKGVDESGEIYVIDSKDQTRKLSEINTDETTRNLYKSAAKYDTAAANVFVQGYNRSASVSSYRTAFNAFYSAGTAGQRSFSEVMKDNSSLVRYMADEAYAEKAFDIGRQERLNADKAVYQKKQTGNFPAKGVYQSKTVSTGEEAVDEFYTAVSKKLGLDVDRVPSIVNRNGQEANAQYDPTKHKMTVSASAENEWQASVHELTHAAFSYNSAKMKEVKKAIVSYYLKNNSETDLESILEQYKLAYEGDSRADIEEEFIADALGGMFSTQDGVQDFLNWLQNESGYNAEKKKDILQRITEWLSDIIEAIKEIMNDGELNGAGKLFAKQQCDELAKIRKMFLEALDGAGVNYREKGAVEGNVRNSLVESFFDDKGNQYENAVLLDTDFFDGLSPYNWSRKLSSYVVERSKNNPFILPIVDENGETQQLQFAKPNERVSKNGKSNHKVLDELVYSKDNISKLAVVHIDEIVGVSEENNPYYTNEHNHQWLDENGWLHRNAYVINSKNGDVFNLTLDIAKTRDGRCILFATKGKIKKVGNVQLNSLKIKGSGQNSNYEKSLSHYNTDVKNQNRVYLDAVEKGDMETAQKLVDEAAKAKGYTIKGYHATNADFTTFDINKTSDINFHGKGIYFTNSTRDIENNYENYEGPDPWQKIEERAYEIADEKYGLSYEDTLTGDADIIGKLNECYDEAIEEFKSTIRRITAYLKFDHPLVLKKGDNRSYDISQYDGIIDEQVYENIGHSGMDENTVHYVIFNPRNIKSAEVVTYDENGEVIPLSERFNDENSDIRYSKKVDLDKSEELSQLEAEKKNSIETDSKGRKLTREQSEFFKDSKIRVSEVDGWKNTITPDGDLFPVYHGTNSDEFFEFDKKAIGSANDTGWYGKGFYFAFDEREARFYGRRTMECYLNVKKPFFFSEEMQSFKGQSSGDVNFDFASFVINLSEKFPEIAKQTFVQVAEFNSDEVTDKSFTEFAEEIKEIYDSNRFKLSEVDDGGTTTYQYVYSRDIDNIEASEKIKRLIREKFIDSSWSAEYYKDKGAITESEFDEILDLFEKYGESRFRDVWIPGRFTDAEYAKKNRLSSVITYLANKKYSYINQHMPEYYMENYIGDDLSQELRKRGYDGILQSKFGDEIVVFDSNQIKLTDNKNPTDNSDIRYSLPLSNLNDIHASNIEKVTELGRVEAQLTAHINYIGSSQTKRTLSTLNIQEVAKQLRKEYQSKADIHELTPLLEELYKLFEQGRVSSDVVKAHIDSITEKIINESVHMKPDISEYAKEILRELRGEKIKLSDVQKQQAAYHFGSYNEFRKALMGSVVLSEEGTPLDERWQSLCGMFPGRFDSETVDTDQPYALFEAIKELRNTYEDESGLDVDSVKAQLSADIRAGYISIPTVAQYSNQYSVLEQELLQSLKAEKQMYKQIYSQAYKNAQSEYGLQLKKMRADQAEEILRAKARMNQRVENIADTRLREKKRNRLIKTVKRLDRLLRTPGKGAPSAGTNKYGQEYVHLTNIPEDFKKAVIDFCYIFIENDAGVFTGKYKDSEGVVRKKVFELLKQYGALKESKTYIGTAVNDDIKEKIEKAHEIVADKRLAQLTAAELDTLNEIADHLITVINNEVEMWVGNKRKNVEEYAGQLKADLESQKDKKYRTHFIPDKLTGMQRKIFVKSLKPGYIFEDLGETWSELHNGIYNGEARSTRNLAMCKDTVQGLMKKYHTKDWLDKKDDVLKFKLETENEEIKLTRQQAMSLYALSKRQASLAKKGKETFHLDEGGFTYEKEVEVEQKGKKFRVIESKTHLFKISDFEKVDAFLTQEQKNFVDEIVKFMSRDLAALGNEVSMELYGVNLFGDDYYFPFISAQEFINRGEGKGRKKLKSPGWSNPTNHGAGNPLVLMDFTKVVASHCKQMSIYNGEVVALENLTRMWNYTSSKPEFSMKKLVAAKYGTEYVEYIDKYIEDRNGEAFRDDSVTNELFSLYKKSAVMGSASVVIQQPSAIFRALSEIDGRYFLKTSLELPWQRVKSWEEAKKYAPVCILKEIGGYDMLGDSGVTDWMLEKKYKGIEKVAAFFKDSNFRDDVISFGPAFADKITWAHIWEACKKEVAHKEGLRGEKLLEAAGERFTEVINKTQVYDSVSTKSDIMRSPSNKMLTSFMGESLLNYSQLHSGFKDFGRGKKKEGTRKIAAVVTQFFVNAGLVAIVYAARDDDEDKTSLEKYVSAVVENLMQNLNPLNMLPFYRDFLSLMQGFDVSRTDMSIISELIDTADAIWSFATDEKKRTSENFWDIMSGLPHWMGNIIRDGRAAWGTVDAVKSMVQDTNGTVLWNAVKDEFLSAVTFGRKKKTDKQEKLYNAWINGKSGAYEHYAVQYKDGKAVKSALTSQIKDRYLKGSLGEEDVTVQLSRLGYSENDVYYKLREWDAPEQTEETNTEDENEAYLTIDGINSLSSVESDDEGGVSYVYLHNAIAQRDEALIKSEIEDLMNRGAEEKQIKMSVQSKWGRAYRESLDPNERKEIERMIAATGLWRTGEVFGMTRRWRRQAEEEKRKQ